MKRTEPADRGDVGAPPTAKEIRALAKRVMAKEAGAYTEFRRLAEAYPVPVVAEMRTNLAELARTTFATKTMGGNGAYEIGLEAQQRLLLRELVGEAPSTALRLVAETVVYSWTEYWTVSAGIAHRDSMWNSPMALRRQGAALRRFLQALKACRQVALLEGRAIRVFADLRPVAALEGRDES
jgi:hypothetical protein